MKTGPAFDLEAITARALDGTGCTRAEAILLGADRCSLAGLMRAADRVRERHFGRTIQLCAITNARSGACREDCRFCAQSAHHRTGVEIYPLRDAATIARAAATRDGCGATTFGVVTSGPTLNADELGVLLDAIRRILETTSLQPCASLGQLTGEQLRALRQAGLRRFHHNLETSQRFYPQVCTTHSWDERIATVRAAQAAGLEVCSGGLFGLGESWEDRIDLGLTLRTLGVESVPINFLNPVPGTALADHPRLTAEEGLRIISVYRLLLPRATIRVCGGRPTTLGARQVDMFRAGANALMTGDYLTTAGISPTTDRAMIENLGFRLQPAPPHSHA